MNESEFKDHKEIAKEILNKSSKLDHEKVIGVARFLLAVIAGINLLIGIYIYKFFLFGWGASYLCFAQTIVFFVLYLLSKKYTFVSLIIGLVIYAVPQIIFFILVPESFTFGVLFIVRLIIIFLLLWGVVSVNKLPGRSSTLNNDLIDGDDIV